MLLLLLCLFYGNSAVIYTGIIKADDKQFRLNNSDLCFCRTKPNDTALFETVMHTDVDTNVIGNVMTQQHPVCLHLLNGYAVTVFFCRCS